MPLHPTPAQIAASRANGARSAGRPRKILNALPTGLAARATLLPSESGEAFSAVLDAFTARFQPADDAEALCVETMANATFRMRRAWLQENSLLLNAMHAGDQPLYEEARATQRLVHDGTLPALWRQSARLQQAYDKAFANLMALRRLTENSPEKPEPAAEMLAVSITSALGKPEPKPEAKPEQNPEPGDAAFTVIASRSKAGGQT